MPCNSERPRVAARWRTPRGGCPRRADGPWGRTMDDGRWTMDYLLAATVHEPADAPRAAATWQRGAQSPGRWSASVRTTPGARPQPLPTGWLAQSAAPPGTAGRAQEPRAAG